MKSTHSMPASHFCAIWFVVTLCVGELFWLRHHHAVAQAIWIVASVVGNTTALIPRAATIFQKMWMGLTEAINAVLTRIILVIIFYGVLTPLALIFKIIGRDALALRKPKAAGNWHDLDPQTDNKNFEHLY